jgi:hypothetical protein
MIAPLDEWAVHRELALAGTTTTTYRIWNAFGWSTPGTRAARAVTASCVR